MASSPGYSATPLARKLGIGSDTTMVVLGAPRTFFDALEPIPAAVTIRRANRGYRDLTVWFVRSRAELEKRIAAVLRSVGDGGLWIAWPKRAGSIESDVTEDDLREVVLPTGFVDHKVCAIDEDWSGLRFARRR